MKEPPEPVECPLCFENLSFLSFRLREEHADRCIENLQGSSPSEHSKLAGSDNCDRDLKSEPETHETPIKNESSEENSLNPRPDEPTQPKSLKRSRAKSEPEVSEGARVNGKVTRRKSQMSDWISRDPSQSAGPLVELPKESTKPSSDQRPQQQPKQQASEPKKASPVPRTPPFYKTLHFGDTKFAVDAFNYGNMQVDAYFLTHFHSDHYGGLSAKWSHGLIYCSVATANLVRMRLKVEDQYLFPLEMNKSYLINGQSVRLLDANHCPGAAIILFNDKVLHTGDFRGEQRVIDDVKQYSSALDVLYLDTTYLDPGRRFPPQQTVIDICVQYCTAAQQKKPPRSFFTLPRDTRVLVIVGAYTIGKERVAIAIAKALKSKIWVEKSKRAILGAFQDPELDQLLEHTDGLTSQVHMQPMRELTIKRLESMWNFYSKHYTEVIAISPTGWTHTDRRPFSLETMELMAIKRPSIKICKVPYSEHSSFSELEQFCAQVPSTRIISTVSTKNLDILSEWARGGTKVSRPIQEHYKQLEEEQTDGQ